MKSPMDRSIRTGNDTLRDKIVERKPKRRGETDTRKRKPGAPVKKENR